MKMIQIFKFLSIFLLFCSLSIRGQSKDSTKASTETFLNNELNNNLNSNSFQENYFSPRYNHTSIDTSSIWLRTRMQLGEMVTDDPMKSNFNLSVINPLRQQFSDMESMKTIKYILATIQAGAVGYLAYEHIRKFGFLKRK